MAAMTSSNLNFQKSKKSHKLISVRSFVQSFIKIDTTVLAVELPHTHTHTRTHAHTYTHTLIHTPSVSIATYSVKMTEYKNEVQYECLV